MQVEVHVSLVCVDFQQSDVLSLPSFVVTSISLKASLHSLFLHCELVDRWGVGCLNAGETGGWVQQVRVGSP